MLLTNSAEYFARDASLDELHAAAMAIETWDEYTAESLDFIYMERAAHLLERTRPETKVGAIELADHMARIAHDSQRDALDALERPYFARWRLLMELLHRHAERFTLPDEILGRKHVLEILREVARAGGRVAQRDLDRLIPNEGQRSVTLKIMETWDLVERTPGPGNTRTVSITDLGKLAIGDTARVGVAAATTPGKRFCEYMSTASA
jgi:hypothetical protein